MSRIYTVSQINRYIKGLFSSDILLTSVFVRGEVSNLKYHGSGHIYFSLKDNTGTISCVMFAGKRKGLTFRMQDGDTVIVSGSVDVFERDGRYQLYAEEITKEGQGLLYERFLKLKAKLAETGMFDPCYKKKIGAYNRTVGIVTAPGGAAIRDIENIAGRRNPYVRLILYPALVQGTGAKESIAAGIAALDAYGVDVIIVCRGGGSIEDLWAFNEELVARAIFASSTPVISAVGHETDTTIADLVADLRAPTPSAAAEIAVFDITAFDMQLSDAKSRARRLMDRRIMAERGRIREHTLTAKALSPSVKARDQRMRLAITEEHIRDAMDASVRKYREQVRLREMYFRAQNPLDRLAKGYIFAAGPDGRAVRGAAQLRHDDSVTLYFPDGTVQASVEEVRSYQKGDVLYGAQH